MKKYILLTAMAVMAAFACTKVEPQAEEPATLTYNFNIAEKPSFDGATRAVKTGWEEGDKIYIVFDDQAPSALTDFLILQYSASGEWVVAQQPSSSNQPKEEGGTLDALYYANPNPTYSSSDGFDRDSSEGKYMWLTQANVNYSMNDNVLDSNISLSLYESSMFYRWLQICVTGLSGKWKIGIKNSDDSYKTILIWHPRFSGANKLFNDKSQISTQIVASIELNEQSDGHYLYCLPYWGTSSSPTDLTTFKFVLQNDTYGTFTKTFTRSSRLEKKNQAITFQGPQFDGDGNVTNGWAKQ